MFVSITNVPTRVVAAFVGYVSEAFGNVPRSHISLKFSHMEHARSRIYVNIFRFGAHLGHFDVSGRRIKLSKVGTARLNMESADIVANAHRTNRIDEACEALRSIRPPSLLPPIVPTVTENRAFVSPTIRKRKRDDDRDKDRDDYPAPDRGDEPTTDARVCKVCLESEAIFAFVACGHLCVCGECLRRILGNQSGGNRCPICRAPGAAGCIRIYT